MAANVQAFYDTTTGTVTYVVYEEDGKACAVIDSVLDYDGKSGHTSTAGADKIIAFIAAHDLQVEWLLETHAHADHLSAAPYLHAKVGGKIAIGESIRIVQGVFKPIFNLDASFKLDGSQFHHLFADHEVFRIGHLQVTAMHVPGHTPADMAYRIDDMVFVGDTLFMPDIGSARCDFPGGSAPMLYRSIRKLLALPDDTKIHVCHDYPPEGREAQWIATVAEHRQQNVHVHDGVSESEFVAMRIARDATLEMPTLILPAIQVNIRGGELPEPESNGVRYLKIPVNTL